MLSYLKWEKGFAKKRKMQEGEKFFRAPDSSEPWLHTFLTYPKIPPS